MISVEHLTKCYGGFKAVDDLSFEIDEGHVYGFLGPNGAGKSTTMNIMTGCLSATEGTVRIEGHDIFDEPNEAKSRIGYLPEQPPVYPEMTPREYLRFVARAKGVRGEAFSRQIENALAVTQTQDVQNRLIKNLSKGYRQRVGIAQALLGNPSVVILDEPTVGLDPLQIIEIRDLIKTLGKTHTVILSSHILSEVRAVCDQIMIISKGRLVASDTPDHLEKLFAGSMSLELTLRGSREKIQSVLGSVPGVGGLTFTEGEVEGAQGVTLETNPPADLSEAVFSACAQANLPILRMGMRKASLEDVFLELTGTAEDEAPAVSETEGGPAA